MRKLLIALPLIAGLVACGVSNNETAEPGSARSASSASAPQLTVNPLHYGQRLSVIRGKVVEYRADVEDKVVELGINLAAIADLSSLKKPLPEGAPAELREAQAEYLNSNKIDTMKKLTDARDAWKKVLNEQALLSDYIVGQADIAPDGTVNGLTGKGKYLAIVAQVDLNGTNGKVIYAIDMPSGGLKNVQVDLTPIQVGAIVMAERDWVQADWAPEAAKALSRHLRSRNP